MSKKEILEIHIDDRESKEIKHAVYFFSKDPNFKHFKFRIVRLKHCDMILKTKTRIGTVGIEIKRGFDFPSSVMDGRFPGQIIKVKEESEIDNLIFILVGDVKDTLKDSKFNPNAYYGTLGAICTKYQCSVLVVPDDNAAVLQAFYCFKHADLIPSLGLRMNLIISREERQIAAITCIQGIGRELAIRILIKYPISKLAQIKDPKILMEIKGVGEGKAKKIINFFHNTNL